MEKNENGLSVLFPNGNSNASCSDGKYNGRGSRPSECGICGVRQLAMVYSPMQCFRMTYAPDDALMRGTLFEELYKPLEEEW